MELRHALSDAPDAVCVEIREASDAHTRVLDCAPSTTIEQVKHALPALWHPDTLDPTGVRCIHRGQLLAADARIETLAREVRAPLTQDTGRVVLHIAIAPGALQRAEEPRSDPLLASGYFREPGNPLLEFVVRVKPSELESLLHAFVVTFSCYAQYYTRVARAANAPTTTPPRLVPPPGVDLAPAHSALANTALRTAAVSFVETEVLQWTPLRDVRPQDTQPSVERGARALQSVVEARMAFLNDALLAVARLHDMHQWRTQTQRTHAPPAPPNDAAELLGDLGAVAHTLLGLLLRAAVVAVLLSLQSPPRLWWYAGGALALYTAVQAVVLVRERRRERAAAASPTAEPASAPAPEPAADAAAAERAMLDIPRLPARVSHGPWYSPEHWERTLAYVGLADEERAMGFEHTPSADAVQRIHWTPLDFAEPAEEAVGAVPATNLVYTYLALPLYLFVATMHPRIQELRSDALALRREAICALAQKWDALAASGKTVRRAKPRLLEHPYAQRVLRAERERRRNST
ncbi:hypothetical protein MOBT1_001543 [Malassezia obtusa]|uniref:Ubiquitin-like domain-containing protein n=1 Tax=Malassezia obtusa TaxID=76774 RepID=A0AAF0IWB6_9BASI|nr:hypothetical protein MOBT1_001543 [Malassezia obtusa]